MQSSTVVTVLAAFGLQGGVFGGESSTTTTTTTTTVSACQFELSPPFPGYFWDESCFDGGLGCLADGKNPECRFCGAGNYSEIPCPPSSCHFPNEPVTPYFWDTTCVLGEVGCWADGIHIECRFCGEAPFTSVACPEVVGGTGVTSGAVTSTKCSFANEPHTPYYWDPDCTNGQLGCLADGIHPECRFCAQRPFESIACPEGVGPNVTQCYFKEGFEPKIEYFWDESCHMGMLGCWADGIHGQCRFCGSGDYAEVECPTVAAETATEAAASTDDVQAESSHSQVSDRSERAADVAPASTETDTDNDDEVLMAGACATSVQAATVFIVLLSALFAAPQ